MTEKLSLWLTDAAIQKDIINATERDLYIYSFQTTIERMLSWGTIFVLSLCFHVFLQTVVFAIFICAFKMFVGGYHADSYFGCFLLSTITYIVFCMLEPFLTNHASTLVMTLAIALFGVVILVMPPVAHKNKFMSENALSRCRRWSKIVALSELSISILLAFTPEAKSILSFIFYAFLMVASLLLLEKLKNQTSVH